MSNEPHLIRVSRQIIDVRFESSVTNVAEFNVIMADLTDDGADFAGTVHHEVAGLQLPDQKTFWFCTYAKAEFDDADYERKSEMLKALGQNFVLREGNLHVDLLPHLFVLKNGLAIEPLKTGRLELPESSSDKRKNRALDPVYSAWSSLIREVRAKVAAVGEAFFVPSFG